VTETERLSDEALHAIYDRAYAEGYDPHAVPRMERLLPHMTLAADAVVADYGCGNGVLAQVLAGKVARYVGVDFSEAFVEVAERRRDELGLRNTEFCCRSITAFCADHPAAFDAAFALDFSEHVYDDQFLELFAAIRTSLKPGAPLYLHTPNREYVLERFRASGVMSQIEGHVAVRSAAENERLLRACGFSSVETTYLAHYLTLPARFHFLGGLPWVGPLFRARLFQVAR
jgi:2-polyprenyl-6-hydroxyphenyl methylase / 3-demethylubiquinone-9 3-methyltransferase